MKIKKLYIAAIAICALGAMIAIPLTGCRGEISFTTASLSEATMCSDLDSVTGEPVGTTNTFTTDAPKICCSVKLSHAPDETEVKADWIYLQGEAADLTNYLIDSWNTTTGGERYLGTYMTPPDNGWPRGDYKVVFYIDGKEKLSVPFTVK
ncbi:MAG: hypothetical protein J7K77_01535 [Dehalococcoidales bacterium]|nr:hypothetical protein [Dehalococcoidales bacterium]